MSFETWPTQSNGIYDISYAAMLQKTFIDGYIDCSGSLYNRLGNVIIGDSSNPDFDPSSNGITLNTTRICLGKDSSVTGDNGVAIGNSATTGLQENSISIGYNSIVDASNSVAIGADASANGLNSIALGYNSGTGSYTNSVAIGNGTTNTGNNQIKIGTSASAYQMDGRLNLVNSSSSSLISYGNAIKMFRAENGLTIGNYGKFAVNVADTTAEPTSVPARNGINMIFLQDNGISYFGTANNNTETHIRSSLHGTFLDGYGSTNANLTITNTNQVIKSSDRRLKENITHYDKPSIEKIMKLKPAYYTWKDDKSKNPHINLGFIAQEVEDIIPEAVDGKKYEFEWEKDEEGNPILDDSGNLKFTDTPRYRGFSDRPLIAVLVKAVQEQQEQIEALQQLVNNQQQQIETLMSSS
jgi:hypothetical protein